MTREEFMELVYETFADEPDNVLANGIIEAADAYVEYEKAKLLQEGTTKDTTSDTISKTETVEHLRRMLEATVPNTDYDEGFIDGVEFGISTVQTMPSAQPEQQHGRVFKGIVVKYPEYCIYPEYKGKPYFSIKYTEKGQSFIGYGTYNPEVLSEYLKEYFMPPAQPEQRWILCDEKMPEEHEWLGTKKFGTTISDEVYVTFENEKGERFCKHMSFQNGKLSNYDQFHMDTWYKGSKPIAWMPLPEPYKPNNK